MKWRVAGQREKCDGSELMATVVCDSTYEADMAWSEKFYN